MYIGTLDVIPLSRAWVPSCLIKNPELATTSPLITSSITSLPAAPAPDGTGGSRSGSLTPTSPALSTASTADVEDDDIESSPALPPLPAPKLTERASAILRGSSPSLDDDKYDDADEDEDEDEDQFGTASWGSPYPRRDLNLRRQSFSSEGSEDFPIHHLDINTPFLRPPPVLPQSQAQPELQLPVSAAAAVLVHRVRRPARGLTEGWIRTHTVAEQSAEPRHWLSDGDSSEHSSLSGSESGWFHDQDPRTPRAAAAFIPESRPRSRHPRASSTETLKPDEAVDVEANEMTDMAVPWAESTTDDFVANVIRTTPTQHVPSTVKTSPRNMVGNADGKANLPITPTKIIDMPLPKEPSMTSRIKKKVPWKGKNIMIMIPRDDERGFSGHAPMPLRQDEIQRIFNSWRKLGYSVEGFDLPVEGFILPAPDVAQSKVPWPTVEDLAQERASCDINVVLPDMNAWQNYVIELQEAKLRALGVSFGNNEPDLAPSISQPSRQPSTQYPPLPFSPPIPTSSASSSHAPPGFPFSSQFILGGLSAAQSPVLPAGASPVPFGAIPGKFNSRQSVSFPASNSPFQQSPQGWPSQAGILQGSNPHDPPSLMNFNGIMSPQSPHGPEGFQHTGSPAFNMHQRHQSLQYLPQQLARASPRMKEVREDEEEEAQHVGRSPSKSQEPTQRNADQLQAEIDDAEYHLEEQLRNELEHEDYNPQTQAEYISHVPFALTHTHQASGGFVPVEHFANEPGKPLVLHHPRPHSRGHSLSQSFFQERPEAQEGAREGGIQQQFAPLKNIPETRNVEESFEIETNPSNLGTPVQNFDFAAAISQHGQSNNPWQDAGSAASSSAQRSNHGSKSSFSKFNVEAPEFKFNPKTTFTPELYSFSASGFQPAVLQAGPTNIVDPPPVNPISPFTSSTISNISAFAPGQNEFSFSSSGPRFRPDAPAFTPLQSLPSSTASPRASSSKDLSKRTDFIFGDTQIDSEASAQSDGQHESRASEESRAKRAKSAVPGGDDVSLFADRPDSSTIYAEETMVEPLDKETHSGAVDDFIEDNALPADTSLSSIASNHMDTQATTVAPSESSPIAQAMNKWTSLEFNSHKSSSAVTPAFVSRAVSQLDGHELPQTVVSSQSPAEPTFGEPEPAPESARHRLIPKGLAASRFASPASELKGLAASRFAMTPPSVIAGTENMIELIEQDTEPTLIPAENRDDHEPTFEEIDAVMRQMLDDPSMGVKRSEEMFTWSCLAGATAHTPPDELQIPSDQSVRDGNSITPRQYHDVIGSTAQPLLSIEPEDPFIDPLLSSRSLEPVNEFDEGEINSEAVSDWEGTFSEDEHTKLQSRAQFFDGRINEVVDGLLASRLEPLEKTLFSIRYALESQLGHTLSPLREWRSTSAEAQESDADDEDDEPPPRRSVSPKRDRRMEQIRLAIMEALAAQQHNQHIRNVAAAEFASNGESTVLKCLEEIKEQLATSFKSSLLGGEANSIAEESSATKPQDELASKMLALQAKCMDLEQRLHLEQDKVEKEVVERRAAEDASAEVSRKLQATETRIEVEIINRSVFDQRVADFEERLRHQEEHIEEEVRSRRAADDKLSEVQRLFHISSGEENRLRQLLEQRDQQIKSLEQLSGETAMKMATLEAARNIWTQSQAEMTDRVNALEGDLRNVRQDNNNWRAEAERADESARRSNGELCHTVEENRRLRKSLDNVASQLEENERLRESWRSKFMSLQEDMGEAAREVAEETAQRIKKDQAMLARQEVLTARLQAEAKTRERLEVEMERLQENELSGMRAINECKRLEDLLGVLRTENFNLQQSTSRCQREFEEARESGASEVNRTRMALQNEVEAANNQVNVVREEYDKQNSKLRAEIDSLQLEFDTAKAQNEMLLEDAHSCKATELEELSRKHQNELEDVQTRYERQVNDAIEDGQRTEQHLLERLSLSTSKTEHLQDRILHLEEKLEATKQAAKSVGTEPGSAASLAKPAAKIDVPGKISLQALRESIMVLQEQLQAREQRIEELEQIVAGLDPDATTKIGKRDDEISWLRELLAVRQGDLQDIIMALSENHFDRAAVKDAAIRLTASLQMEEQERERAMSGGSAITLPNIAQTLHAATPRVAQTIGPLAAAWGNWRKGSQSGFRGISGALSSPAIESNATPSKSGNNSARSNSLLGGLLTPPASGLRQTPTPDKRPQPTAFPSTGRRFTAQSAQGRTRGESNASRRSDQMPVQGTSPRRQELKEQLMTPPMMHHSVYDSDAQPGDFDDHDFFEEED